jgi:hypothetical protein
MYEWVNAIILKCFNTEMFYRTSSMHPISLIPYTLSWTSPARPASAEMATCLPAKAKRRTGRQALRFGLASPKLREGRAGGPEPNREFRSSKIQISKFSHSDAYGKKTNKFQFLKIQMPKRIEILRLNFEFYLLFIF